MNKNRLIARNTLIMSFRMLLVTILTLIIVRVALRVLGVEDYGIYGALMSLVCIAVFVSSSMQMAFQRFYSYAIGEKDSAKQNAIFNLSFLIFLVITLIFVALAETAGLWFLQNKMTIPTDRMHAALWIYQFAVIGFIVNMLTIPFSSMLIAREDMGVYAAINLAECALKLLSLFLIPYLLIDSLILYGFFILVITILKESITIFYSKKHYNECYFKFSFNKKLFKEIYSYSGWTLFGTLAGVAYNQGNNLLVNMFFNPIANAARGVAFQVGNALSQLSSGFFMVVSPQIVKSYAENNRNYMINLFYMSSKFVFCVMLMLFVPLLLETKYIFSLWLDKTGEYMIVFTRLTLISTLIMSLHSPITTIVQAEGSVKIYHGIVETITLLTLPLSYLFFKRGYSVEYTFYISIIVFATAHFVRIIILKKLIRFSLLQYCKNFILPVTVLTIISFLVNFYLHTIIENNLFRLFVVVFSSVVLILTVSLLIVFNKTEKQQLFNFVRKYYEKKIK